MNIKLSSLLRHVTLRTFADVSKEPDALVLSVKGGIRFTCNTGRCLRYYWRHITEHTACQLSMSLEVTMVLETVIASVWSMTPCDLVDKCEHFGLTHFLFNQEV